jgi:hypothetical protein
MIAPRRAPRQGITGIKVAEKALCTFASVHDDKIIFRNRRNEVDYFSKSIFSQTIAYDSCFNDLVFGLRLFAAKHPLRIKHIKVTSRIMLQNVVAIFGSHPHPRHPASSPWLLSRPCRYC